MQIVPIALQQQAVEAGRARDKGRVADVGNALPASSQVWLDDVCVITLCCVHLWMIACCRPCYVPSHTHLR